MQTPHLPAFIFYHYIPTREVYLGMLRKRAHRLCPCVIASNVLARTYVPVCMQRGGLWTAVQAATGRGARVPAAGPASKVAALHAGYSNDLPPLPQIRWWSCVKSASMGAGSSWSLASLCP